MALRRASVVVLAVLVASLGVLTGSVAVVPPGPAGALPPAGISTLSGTGARGHDDGSATTATFEGLVDMAISPDGAYLYVIDLLGSGSPATTNTIRKVSTATGEVTTFAQGGPLDERPRRIQVDATGAVWISHAALVGGWEKNRLVRYDSSGTPTTMVTNINDSDYLAFTIDPSGTYAYFIHNNQGTDPDAPKTLNRMAISAMPADADTAEDLGGVGNTTRDSADDFAWSPQGELYLTWLRTEDCCGMDLYRFDGFGDFTKISEWHTNERHLAFTGTSSALYTTSDGGADSIRRFGDYGSDGYTIVAGGGPLPPFGPLDGDPGSIDGPRGLAFSPDGKVAYTADAGHRRIRQALMPPDPYELSAEELCGPCNRGELRQSTPDVADPVDVATGNLTESFTDLVVPGRGPEASASRTYNSLFSDRPSLFGEGWWSPLDMNLVVGDRMVSVYQENGALLPFAVLDDGSIEAPSRVTSTLEQLTGGDWRLDRNDGDIVTFDSSGQVTGWEDRNGYVTTVTRPSGSQIVMTTPGGRTLTFAVSGGLVTSVTDDSSPARTVDYTYTTDRLTMVETFKVNASDTGRVTWEYGYDGNGRLDAVTDPRGNSNSTHYDGQGRVDFQLDDAGARTDIAYGGTFPDEWRDVTGPAYDAVGTRPVVRYQLDGLLTESITSGYGTGSARTTTYTYDRETLGVETVTGPGSEELASHSYDGDGNLLATTDAAGRTTTFAYDDVDNPRSPTSITDPDGNVTTTTYDDDGNVLSTSMPVALVGTSTDYGTATTTFEHDDSAHPEDVTAIVAPDQQGATTPKKTVITYRAVDGQVSYVQGPEGYLVNAGQKPGHRTTYTYDSRGFVTSMVTPLGNGTSTPTDDFMTTYTVNDFGMVQSTTDPLDAVSSQMYDGNGNVVSTTDANSQTTTTEYDAMNRPTVVHRADGSDVETTYFPNGAVKDQVNGLADATSYTYTVHGEVATTTDPNGQVTGYAYDSLGRLATRTDPGGTCPSTACVAFGYDSASLQLDSVSYTDAATPDITDVGYDALGRRSSVTRSAGAGQTWARDNRGQLRSTTDVNGRTTDYDWTLNGNLASVTYPGQTTPVTYTYDSADRMTSVTDWASRVTDFSWTRDHQWRNTTFPSSGNTLDTRTYDEAGRLSGIEWKRGTTVVGSVGYTRDAEGLIDSETPTGGTFSTKTWDYDDIDQLDTVDAAGLEIDDAGNLTLTEDGTYQAFDPAQQLCWSSPTATSGDCTTPAADATTYAYDARGNRTTETAPGPDAATGYTYDQENRMTAVDEVGVQPLTTVTGTPIAGDYSGDGADDVFWYNAGTTADWATWGTDRDAFGRLGSAATVDGTGYRPISGDFDGDGHEDIFWYVPGAGADPIWFWFGDATGEYVERSFSIGLDRIPFVGDFDGDGFDDVFLYGLSGNSDTIWFGNADVDTTASFTAVTASQGGTYIPEPGDFDGDGYDDILWYRPGPDTDVVWFGSSTRNSWTTEPTPIAGTYELEAGDYDGDGKDDVLLYSGAGTDTVWWGSTRSGFGTAGSSTSVALATGVVPTAGDFDGDGEDDLLLHDAAGTTDDVWWGTTTRADLGTTGNTGLPSNTGGVATYAYDTTGLRNAKTVDGTTTEFTWGVGGGLPLMLSQHEGGTTTHVVYGPGGTPIYEVTGSTVTYYHQDHQGSTRLTTNGSGTVVGRYAYDAYGRMTTNSAPSVDLPVLAYNGQYTDEETGFIYLRARYMDPVTGQFTTRDPIVASTRDPYSYAGRNPVAHTDPTGLAFWDDYCVMGVNCPDDAVSVAEEISDDFVEAHPEVAQEVVDFGTGVLDMNPITAATNAAGLTDTGQYAQGTSGWRWAGRASMLAVDLWAGGGTQAARVRDSGTAQKGLFAKHGALFGRGGKNGGCFNRNDIIRMGWGWRGSHDLGTDVFRIAIGPRGGRIHGHLSIWEAGKVLRRWK